LSKKDAPVSWGWEKEELTEAGWGFSGNGGDELVRGVYAGLYL